MINDHVMSFVYLEEQTPCTVARTKIISSYIICKHKLENILYIVVFFSYIRAADIWIEYCRYDVKPKSINQSINQIYVIG